MSASVNVVGAGSRADAPCRRLGGTYRGESSDAALLLDIDTERSSLGQRLFEPVVADQVRHIRMPLAAGPSTRAISELLGCIHEPGRLERCAVPLLVDHLRTYDSHIAELVSARETLQGLIDSSIPNSSQPV